MCVEMGTACAWLSETDSESGWLLGVCMWHLRGCVSLCDLCAFLHGGSRLGRVGRWDSVTPSPSAPASLAV